MFNKPYKMKGFIGAIGIVGLIILGIVLVLILPSPIYGYILIGTTIIATMSILIGIRVRQARRHERAEQALHGVVVI